MKMGCTWLGQAVELGRVRKSGLGERNGMHKKIKRARLDLVFYFSNNLLSFLGENKFLWKNSIY
jgi:hypothetical protein